MKISGSRIVWIVLFGGIVIIWFQLMHSESSPSSDETQSLMSVTMTPVVNGTVEQTIETSGVIVPKEDITVTAEVSGARILDVLVEEGQSVTKGQVLARLDAQTIKNQHSQLTAELEKAKDDYDRVFKIKDTGAVSLESVAQKKAAYESLKAQADNAQLNVTRAEIISPAAGVIYKRSVSVGELTQSSEILFKIAAEGKSELEIIIPESSLSKVSSQTKSEIFITGRDKSIPSSIRIISPRIDSLTRTAMVRLALNTSDFIPIGMFGRAKLTLSSQQGLTLPSSALQQDTKGTFVWISENNVVKRQPVNVLLRGENALLVDGIKENQDVVARAGTFLQDGDKIIPLHEQTNEQDTLNP